MGSLERPPTLWQLLHEHGPGRSSFIRGWKKFCANTQAHGNEVARVFKARQAGGVALEGPKALCRLNRVPLASDYTVGWLASTSDNVWREYRVTFLGRTAFEAMTLASRDTMCRERTCGRGLRPLRRERSEVDRKLLHNSLREALQSHKVKQSTVLCA